MKRILATTALTAAIAMPAFAEQHVADTTVEMDGAHSGFIQQADETNLMASTLIGKRVYVSETDVDDTTAMNDADPEWDDIGEVNDVVLSRNGEVEGILVDVGGFLGMGEKTVGLTMDDLKLVSDGDDAGDYFITLTSSKEALDQAPAFERANAEMTQSDVEMTQADGTMTETNSGTETPLVNENAAAERPMDGFEREGYSTVALTQMSSDELVGTPVYDSADNRVGEISEVLIATDGVVTDAIIDVGGFLGIGEKPVAISFDGISLQQQTDGDDLRAYVGTTEQQLEEFPTYED